MRNKKISKCLLFFKNFIGSSIITCVSLKNQPCRAETRVTFIELNLDELC